MLTTWRFFVWPPTEKQPSLRNARLLFLFTYLLTITVQTIDMVAASLALAITLTRLLIAGILQLYRRSRTRCGAAADPRASTDHGRVFAR